MVPRMNLRWSRVLCLLLLAFCTSAPLVAGWKWERPPNMVIPDCGKRNPIFYVGQPVRFTLPGTAATRYEVRDYYGNLVDQGSAGSTITLNVSQPGWYKLYLYSAQSQDPWGDSVGGTMFVIFRDTPGFPALPAANVPRSTGNFGGSWPLDIPTRAVLGMGPQRHVVEDCSKPDEAITRLAGDIALDQQYYLPYDPQRTRALLIAFPNGTSDLAGVRKIVDHFKGAVKYWEPRNEPQDSATPQAFVLNEMKPFYETVKSVDSSLKVIGPGTVSIGPSCLGWIEDFFKAGGRSYIDAFSFHAYNNVNGDLWLARHSLDELNLVLAKYGADKLEKWQTEQGYFAAVYGSYQPRLQGRWTMLQMMVYEQYGIPKEHNHYWYDRSHGFWDFPTWWENEDDSGSGLNPAAPLMRVWSEELYGKSFAKAYDFGSTANNLYIGSLFSGGGKQVAAFMSAGSTDGEVTLQVTGSDTLHIVSAFGVTQDFRVTGGRAKLPVSELPVYVELAASQTIEVVPDNRGPNYARLAGVQVTSSTNSSDPLTKIVNGQLENWYYAQGSSPGPWMSGVTTLPAWVEINLPGVRKIDSVIIYASPPWQSQGTLLDYELQYDQAGQWVSLDHIQEPTKTFKVYTPTVRCTVDSFFSDRWVFQHHFSPVTTQKIRLLVHDVSFGGGATQDVVDAGGQAGPKQISLREVEVFNSANLRHALRGRVTGPDGRGLAGVPVTISGWELRSALTDTDGYYVFEDLPDGVNVTVFPPMGAWPSEFVPRQYSTPNLASDAVADFVAMSIASSLGSGLTADYFNTPTLSDLKVTRIDPKVDFDWGKGSPDPLVNVDYFSVRWSGLVQPRYSESYQFRVVLDDGVRLWVNGQLLIDSWQPGGGKDHLSASIALVASQKYDLRLEYNESYNDARIRLLWSSASQSEEVIPASQLYPARTDTATLVTTQTLTVQSSPVGASVEVSPADKTGKTSGDTALSLTYNTDTSVTLTANPLAGYTFQKWQVDGIDQGSASAVTIAMDASHTATAVYAAIVTHALTVQSSPVNGAAITASPADNSGKSSGKTKLTWTYNHGASVTITPGALEGYSFQKWQLDGVDNQATGAITIPVEADHTATAVYVALPVASLVFSVSSPQANPLPGSRITYTVTYSNPTPVTVINAVITTPIPPNTVFVPASASNGGVYDSTAKVVRWTIPSVPGNTSGTVSFHVGVN